jgi:hypothetical protein
MISSEGHGFEMETTDQPVVSTLSVSAAGHQRIAAAYRRFAEVEARGRSPLYEVLARGVADDPAILSFLGTLPQVKQQPNLLFAAVRFLFGTPAGWEKFRAAVLDNADAVGATMLSRSTQTNEPGRCAVLLPVMALLPQPLALIEVGASAGLCLLPDRYGYDYAGRRVQPANEAAHLPVFPCAIDAKRTPLPAAPPWVVWRAGLDLNPLDVADPDRMAWLRALVWPEQTGRRDRLDAAIRIAATEPPRLVRGDLRHNLASLCAEAPTGATLVIFHTAVLAYVVDQAERAEFAKAMPSLCDFWIASEALHVFPNIAARARDRSRGADGNATGTPTGGGVFLLSVNGAPVGWADPHGAWLDWIANPPASYRPAR